jgi:hypothetical protein
MQPSTWLPDLRTASGLHVLGCPTHVIGLQAARGFRSDRGQTAACARVCRT